MSKKKKIIGILTLVLLLVGAGWWMFASGEDPQVQKVQQMRQDLFVEGKRPDMEKMKALWEEERKLTPEQRMQMDGPRRQEMEQRMKKEMTDYFSMTKEQRNAYLDKRIKEMEKRQKEMASGKAPQGPPPGGGAGGPPPGAGAGGPGGPGGGPGGPGGGPGGPGGPGGGPGGRPSADQMRQHRVGMLDHHSPQDRAMHSAMMSDMAKRRVAAGLSPMPEPPGRPPR